MRPTIGQIPVRFHLYWAGADRDGTVGGYFFAIVETLPVPPEGGSTVPSLPGPKARDYQFTTKTDSIFIFRASEEVNERQHAFYIYAVDNKGRADATPARFVFSSYDRFPPRAIIDEFKAVGTEYVLRRFPEVGVDRIEKTYFVTDFFEISNDHPVPRDTIPADSRMTVRWHGEPTIPSTVVTGYKYKLDEADFNAADSSVHTATYNTGVGDDRVAPGVKIFTLRAIGQSGWRGEATRWFQMNFAPDTWFAGPNPNDPLAGWQTHQDANGKRYWYLDYEATGWTAFQGVPGSQLSSDSVQVLPALRPERKTFFEVYNNRLWLHTENDTVHLNSWVIVPTGGFDRDSPYTVRVNQALLPGLLRGTPVLTPDGPNGSPIGFRIKIPVRDAAGGASVPTQTTTYPEFDPASVKHQPVINGYQGMTTAGRAYVEIAAEDGNTTVDQRIEQRPGGSIGVVARTPDPSTYLTIDECVQRGGTRADCELRFKILTFYVNKAPRLQSSGVVPAANALITRNASGTIRAFRFPATDPDELDPTAGFNPVGGNPPNYGSILRRKVAILGKLTGTTRDTCYIVPAPAGDFLTETVDYAALGPIPDWIAAGPITVRVRLCDCLTCDVTPTTSTCPFGGDRAATPTYGTCVNIDIPCQLAAPEPGAIEDGSNSTQRPGSADTGRRQQ